MIIFPALIILLVGGTLAFFYFKGKPAGSTNLNIKHNNINFGKYYTLLAHMGKTPVVIPEHSRYMHTQVIGSTGSGKTRYVFYPSIYQDIVRGAGCFILDVKSNMFPTIGSFVQRANRYNDFYYFDIASPKSLTYNPLLGDDPNEVASRICTALYSDSERSEQFYKEIGYRFITSLVRLLYCFGDKITFTDLYNHANNMELLRSKCEQQVGNLDSEYFMNNWVSLPEVKRQQQLIGMINKLAIFVTSKWAPLINTTTPDIVMEDIVLNNKIILFGVSSQLFSNQYRPIAILTLMNLQNVIAKRYGLKNPGGYFVYLDEFKDIVYPQFADLINKAREAKVGIMLGHQSLGDLSSIDKSFENIILTNSRNKIILNLDNVESAEYFSKLIGTKKSIEVTNSYAKDGIWEVAKGSSKKLVDEFIVHPNRLKSLPAGVGVLRIAVSEEGSRHYAVKLHHVPELPTFNMAFLKKRSISPVVEKSENNSIPVKNIAPESPITNEIVSEAPIVTPVSGLSIKDKINKAKTRSTSFKPESYPTIKDNIKE